MDAGASIVVTQVDTVEQAKHIIFSAKFGRKAGGGRSVPPFRLIPNLTDVRDDPKHHGDWCQASNDQAAIMIQIESLEGLENLDDILTQCPEIDAVWLGTLDIRVSMGLPGNGGLGGNEPEWHEALGKYFEITTKHNKSRGGFALGPDEVFSMMQERLDFIVCAAEVLQLTSLQCDLERARNLCAGRVKSAANGAAKAPKKEKDVAIADDKPANGSA